MVKVYLAFTLADILWLLWQHCLALPLPASPRSLYCSTTTLRAATTTGRSLDGGRGGRGGFGGGIRSKP